MTDDPAGGTLRATEARWRTLAAVDPNGILVMDDRSVILAANEAVERILGYAPAELVGRPMSLLIPERFREAHRAGVERYLATGKPNIPWSGVELTALSKSGREVPVEIAFGEYTEEGQHVFAGFIQDLSAWKREEARRAAEHGVIRVLASNAPPEEVGPRGLRAVCEALGWDLGAFWVADSAGERIRCQAIWHRGGAALEEFARASRETVLAPGAGLPGRVWREGSPLWIDDVLRDDNFPRLQSAAEVGLHAAFAVPIHSGGEVVGVMEFFAREEEPPDEPLLRTMEVIGHEVGQYLRRRRAERERDHALRHAIEARELAEQTAAHAEELQGEVELAYDDLRRANEELRTALVEAETARAAAEGANRSKAEFLASMSHELRTPLNAILGYSDLIQAGIPAAVPEGALRQVERIGLAAHHLLSLIEEILGFARLQAGREEVHAEEFDTCTLIKEVRSIVEPLATGKDLKLRVSCPDGPLPMTSDPRKLRQILIGLLGNAVKFTETGAVHLRVRADDAWVSFQVRDTGPGIAPEDRRRIFEPFWQADQSMTRAAGGTGLGLAVAARLASALGGRIRVRSELGSGSTFTVRLPRHLPSGG